VGENMGTRKSKAQRLAEVNELIGCYDDNTDSKEFFDWDYRFLKSIQEKLVRGKVLTPRQRAKVDGLIDEGFKMPPAIDEKLCERIDLAISVYRGRDTESQALKKFKNNIRKGYKLSEKQSAWMEEMLSFAESVSANENFAPSDEDRQRLARVVECSKAYSPTHWWNHQGDERVIEDIKKYLAGDLGWISEKTMQRGIKAVRGVLKQIEEPRFVAGQQCYVRNGNLPDYRQHDFNVWGMIISGPFFKELRNGVDVFYDVLVDGEVKNIRCKSIRKRR
jgi:hypothetical protein